MGMNLKQMGAIAGALCAGVVVGAIAVASGPLADEPGVAGAEVLDQDATASSGGVTIEARDAVFSGTETIVRVDITDTRGKEHFGFLRADGAELVGFTTGMAFSTADAESGSTLLVLPSIDGNGAPTIRIRSLELRGDGTREKVEGDWTLALDPPDDLAAALRVEDLGTTSAADNKITIDFHGLRSTSQTVVYYTIPTGLYELSTPRLRVEGGNWIAPIAVRAADASHASAIFERTAFGEAIEVSFGPFARPETGETHALTVDLSQSEESRDVVTVVLADDEGLFISAERFTRQDDAEMVALTVRGNWDIEPIYFPEGGRVQPWSVRDASGAAFEPGGASQHWTKDDQGSIGPGTTTLEFEVGDADLTAVTLTLGRGLSIERGNWAETLGP